MINRYTRPEMGDLWSEQQQFQAWLDVELAACAAWAEVGVIPRQDVEALYARASFDVARIHEIEQVTRHDVVAFTQAVGESLGPEKKWVHYGLTSSDVVDTAWSYQLKQANGLLLAALDRLLEVLAEKARAHKYTLMIGRTHGVHAEPTTMGLKLALFYAEMQRNRARFVEAAEGMRVGKLSGAVGTFAHLPPEVERLTCEKLGLRPAPISTQILQRDRHAHYLAVLALVGATLEKMAVEVRHLQRSEVREVEEAFGKGQKGSSAMPHKRNPWRLENVTGLARVIRGYAGAALENQALWHERDISNSSVERVIFPDSCITLDFMLHRLAGLVESLVVDPARMRENLELTRGLAFSGTLLLELTAKDITREDAYALVQKHAMDTWDLGGDYRERVLGDPAITGVLSKEEIDRAFSLDEALRHVDAIFERTLALADSEGERP